jgi:Protein of unknown function (DUF4038)/Putative collagen-binding domain of a collagenase
MKKYTLIAALLLSTTAIAQKTLSHTQGIPQLSVSANHRFLQTSEGKPFFWLGDTGWLLFSKSTQEEAIVYLDDRKAKGFNVVQVMGLHNLSLKNAYGDSALIDKNVAQPKITDGNSIHNPDEYDYWDHIDFVIDQAAERGLFIGFVPVWGSNIKAITPEQAKAYALFLTQRYGSKSNIIWLNGGDVKGSDALDTWNVLGQTLRENDKKHLITYHPRGRYCSSDWFHTAGWLDFNMAQSGHRTYEQDTLSAEKRHYGEDNWRYIQDDYAKTPTKPILDGEPSYENIPYGLHDPKMPRWNAAEIRRYGYWSVFAGAFGFTYGHNSVMQMFKNEADEEASYAPLMTWKEGLKAEGAGQIQHLKQLMESDPHYFDRKPAQDLVLNQGKRYDYIVATQSSNSILAYTYTGRNIELDLSALKNKKWKAFWFNPRNGGKTYFSTVKRAKMLSFNPPNVPQNGNDWVLVLEGL